MSAGAREAIKAMKYAYTVNLYFCHTQPFVNLQNSIASLLFEVNIALNASFIW